jgi:membrane protein YqaA with SNARE-associated domain
MPVNSTDYYVEIDDRSADNKIVLPSELDRMQAAKPRNPYIKYIKWTIIILIVLYLYFNFHVVKGYFFDILKQNPTIYSYYLYMEAHIANATYIGLFFVSILGSLFFLALPSEMLFIYYLGFSDHFFPVLIVLMIAGNLVGLFINYAFGWVLGERFLLWMFKEKKFWQYKDRVDRYGGYLLFIGNILPGPIEVLVLFYGGFKFNLKRYMFLCFMGRLTKYIILFIAYYFFWDQILLFYEGYIENLLFWRE